MRTVAKWTSTAKKILIFPHSNGFQNRSYCDTRLQTIILHLNNKDKLCVSKYTIFGYYRINRNTKLKAWQWIINQTEYFYQNNFHIYFLAKIDSSTFANTNHIWEASGITKFFNISFLLIDQLPFYSRLLSLIVITFIT